MAERLPVGAFRHFKPLLVASANSSPTARDVPTATFDHLNGHVSCREHEPNELNLRILSNGSVMESNHFTGLNKQFNFEATTKQASIDSTEDGLHLESEWVEQDEPGVYITLTSLPGGGVKDLKRVRFSRKRFSEKQAEKWWAENRARVYEQYNVRMINKSSIGVGSEDLLQ